jgi:hypothetical protein
MAQRQGVALDLADHLEYSPVVQPDLVVEEPAQLLRQQPNRLLGPLAGLDPVEVQCGEALIVSTDTIDHRQPLE